MNGKDLSAWKSFEALEETIRRDTADVALALNQSPVLVRKWKERPATEEDFQQSGTRNPLDRLETIISTIEKIDENRAYVPIKWLCARFDFLPPVKMPKFEASNEDLMKAVMKWHSEFGQTCEAISESLKDGRLSPAEYKHCLKEAMDSVGSLMSLLNLMEGRVS